MCFVCALNPELQYLDRNINDKSKYGDVIFGNKVRNTMTSAVNSDSFETARCNMTLTMRWDPLKMFDLAKEK